MTSTVEFIICRCLRSDKKIIKKEEEKPPPTRQIPADRFSPLTAGQP